MVKFTAIILLGLTLLLSSLVVQATDPGPNLEEKAVKKVIPVYPPLARRKRVEGKVVIAIQVDANGVVTEVEFLEGNALFKPVTLQAAPQWSFQKSANGMKGHIVFNFKLGTE
ncbi:MAG: TonB family protein [Acidobacteriota bacterium]